MIGGADKPILVFDGDCGFCGYWVARWKRWTRDKIDYVAYQSLPSPFAGLPRAQFEEAVKLCLPDGRIYSAAEAVFRALAQSPAPAARLPLGCYEKIPGVAAVCEAIYRLVARNRTLFSSVSNLLWGRDYQPPAWFLTRWIFLRLLGLIYFIAFVSLWTQIGGLVGRDGILPAGELIDAVKGVQGLEGVRMFPTLCWFDAGDNFLHALCLGGAVLSLLLIAGVAPVVMLVLLWVFYLSLCVAGQTFLSFQWDSLLLETGFLAIFFAPIQVFPNYYREAAPSRIVVWLYRWLLFRLMFMSGVVKLAAADPLTGSSAWRDLSALSFHYETQPLPTMFGWFVHQLPAMFQKLSTILMFSIELVVPFLIFGPKRVRQLACAILLAFQWLIFLTGNYCFFNLLTALLCICVLDDTAWPKGWRSAMVSVVSRLSFGKAGAVGPRWPRWILVPVACLILSLSGPLLVASFPVRVEWPGWYQRTFAFFLPFRSVNHYGLFAMMTTSRPEIVIEGSRDGVEWLAYEFKYKPGDVKRAPCWVQPHQPRLDWQMWFAALAGPRHSAWFFEFCKKILQGSPDVLALLQKNPFPDAPPRYLRARLYDYRFTDWRTLCKEGDWWRRESKGLYCRMMALDGDRLLPLD